MRTSRAIQVSIVLLALLMAGCSQRGLDPGVSASEPYETIRAAMSPCPGGPPQSDTPWFSGFSVVDAWYRVENYNDSLTPVLGSSQPGELTVVAVASSEPQILNVFVNPGAELSIPWGVDMASEVHIGVSESHMQATVIMVTLSDGSAFFPGECGEAIIGDSLRDNLGDQEFVRFIETATGLVREDLKMYVSTSRQ